MFIINRFARLGLTYNARFLTLSRGNADQAQIVSSIRKAKKPVKPFRMFIEDYKEKIKSERLTPDDRATAHQHWHNLSDLNRMRYYDKYVESLKVYYDTIYEDFKVVQDLSLLNSDDKKLLKKVIKFQQLKLKKPVKPLNEFLIYVKEKGKGIAPGSQQYSDLAKSWLALDESKKKVYQETAKKNFTNYYENLCKWERDMVDRGHSLLIRKKTRDEYLKNRP